jgi:hypothetical protein
MLTRNFLGKGGWIVGRGKIGRVLGEGWKIFGKFTLEEFLRLSNFESNSE